MIAIIVIFSFTVGLIFTVWIISKPERYDLKEESEALKEINKTNIN